MNRSNFNPATATRLGDIYPLTWQPNLDSEPRVFGPEELLFCLRHVAEDLPVGNRVDWPIPARIHVYRNHLRNKLAWRMEHFAFLFAGANGQGVYLEALEAGYFRSFDCAARDLWNSMGQKLLVNPLQDEIEQMIAVGVLQDTMVGSTRYFSNAAAVFLWVWFEFKPQVAEVCRQMEKHGCRWLDLIPGKGDNGDEVNAARLNNITSRALETTGWLTVSRAAQKSDVSPSAISHACGSGRLKFVGEGRQRRIDPDSLATYAQRREELDPYRID